ncbi:MAG: hypothetical protein INQ03_19950 [Candidatus Heimdallarchaeota archaeon]|nr:hypothetical protein [Candidatus Heimdallarchaeota archaeon]
MKAIPTIIIILIFLVNVTPLSAQSQSQNDAGSGADAPYNYPHPYVDFNTTYSGTIGLQFTASDGGEDREDCYDLDVNSTGVLVLTLDVIDYYENGSDEGQTLHLALYYIADNSLINRLIILGDDPIQSRSINIVRETNVLLMFYTSDSEIYYNFKLEFTEGLPDLGQNDGGSLTDASCEQPVEFELEQNYTGQIGEEFDDLDGSKDTTDCYSKLLLQTGYLYFNITLTSDSNWDNYITFYVFNDVYYKWSGPLRAVTEEFRDSKTLYFRSLVPKGGTYMLQLRTSDTIYYSFYAWFEPGEFQIQQDMGKRGDAPDDFSNPRVLDINTNGSGQIGPEYITSQYYFDERDCYIIPIDQHGILTLEMDIMLEDYFYESKSENALHIWVDTGSDFYDIDIDQNDHIFLTYQVNIGEFRIMLTGYHKIDYFMKFSFEVDTEQAGRTEFAFLPYPPFYLGFILIPLVKKMKI